VVAVSFWRTPPPGKRWVAGYWKEEGAQWQWVPGFWTATGKQETTTQQITYLPAPPAPPEVAPAGTPPSPETFYVPGHWVWHDAGYVTVGGTTVWQAAGYSWSAGYWARVQPGYVWVPGHYRWTPSGYIYIPGYWDLTVAKRGVLYAPIVVDHVVMSPTFVYTPAYVVRDTIVVDALFVRPTYCHYYFGDYYGPVYRDLGYESCIVYGRQRYDAIIVYERYEHRYDPRWETTQIDVTLARHAGRAPLPPRTLVQQNVIVQQNVTNVTNVTNINNVNVVNQNQVLVPTSQLAAAKGVRTVPLDTQTRLQAKQQAQTIQQVALQRNRTEVAVPAGKPIQPRSATLSVPPPQPVTSRLSAASGVRSANSVQPSGSTHAINPRTPPAPEKTAQSANAALRTQPTSPGRYTPPPRLSQQPAMAPTPAHPSMPSAAPRPTVQPQRPMPTNVPNSAQRVPPKPTKPEERGQRSPDKDR
jgi:hypothetical protein